MSEVRTLVDLPEAAMAHAVVEVVGYFDEDGELRYATRSAGDCPLSTLLGLMDMARFDLIVDNREEAE